MAKLNIIKIKDELKKLERNPAWLADKIDVTNAAVSIWLSGEGMPKYENLEKIGEILGIDWKELLIGDIQQGSSFN